MIRFGGFILGGRLIGFIEGSVFFEIFSFNFI